VNVYDVEAKLALCAVAGIRVTWEPGLRGHPRQVRILNYRNYYMRVWLSWSIERWAGCIATLIEDAHAKERKAAPTQEV
jgi:hypothetical protein